MVIHLLSKLPAPRPADWGWNVSVCIAVLCNRYKSFVIVSDYKASFGDFASDNMASKQSILFKGYSILFAGNDVDHAVPIIERAEEILFSSLESATKKKMPTPTVVAGAVDQAYAERIHSEINTRILRKRGFDVESFRETGKRKCTASAYLALCSRIDHVNISLNFLVVGFAEGGDAHIYCVDGRSAPKCYDSIGMWAIGSGANAALSTLAFYADKSKLNPFVSTETATYLAIVAKFMAESSNEVGREATDVHIHHHGQSPLYVPYKRLMMIRELWEKEGAPRIPSNIDAEMKTHIMTHAEGVAL